MKMDLLRFNGHNIPKHRIIDVRKEYDGLFRLPYIVIELDNGKEFKQYFKSGFYTEQVNRDMEFDNLMRILLRK